MILILDFDGTCVTHEYPRVGKDIGAQRVLKRLLENGHLIVLSTMRSDINHLDDAVKWFEENDIELYGINTNPTQSKWTNSPKAYGHIIVDDTAIGCPTKFDPELSKNPFVDWEKIEKILSENQLFE